jgi:hypothetical protein
MVTARADSKKIQAVRKYADCDTKGPVNSALNFLLRDRANQGKYFYILVLERKGENVTAASSSVHGEKREAAV